MIITSKRSLHIVQERKVYGPIYQRNDRPMYRKMQSSLLQRKAYIFTNFIQLKMKVDDAYKRIKKCWTYLLCKNATNFLFVLVNKIIRLWHNMNNAPISPHATLKMHEIIKTVLRLVCIEWRELFIWNMSVLRKLPT